MEELFKPVGFTASGPRLIRDGSRYDRYFPRLDSVRDTLAKPNGTVEDTVRTMARVIKTYQSDTAKIAAELTGRTRHETLKNDWDFVFNHIQYRLDDGEQIRRPAVSWKERERGVDCDCMTVFISTLLLHQGIDHHIRITKYDGKRNFQHVYIIVPEPDSSYITVDCVLHKFNYEKPYSEKKDFTMEGLGIPIHVLHGTEQAQLPVGYGYIDELISGTACEPKTPEEMLQRLVEIRDYVAANPEAISTIEYRPDNMLRMLNHIIDKWNTPEREQALLGAAYFEAMYNKALGNTLADIDGAGEDDDFIAGLSSDADELDALDDDDLPFDGLGGKRRKQRRKTRRKARRARRQNRRAKRKARRGGDTQEAEQEQQQAQSETEQVNADSQPDPETKQVPDDEKPGYPNQEQLDRQDEQDVDDQKQQEADDQEEVTDNSMEGDFIDGLGLSKAERKKRRQERRQERQQRRKQNRDERKKAKGFFRKLAVGLKQGTQAAFVRFNPLIILARNGFLLAVRMNMFKLSSMLKWAYATPEQVKKAGISTAFYEKSKKALAKTEDIFSKKLGGSKNSLRYAILSGKHGKLSGWTLGELGDDYLDLDNAGIGIAPAAPAIVAAASVIAAVVGAVKSVMGGDAKGAAENVQQAANTIQPGGMTSNEMGMIAGFGEIMDESIETIYGLEGLDALEDEIGELGKARTIFSIIRRHLISLYGQAAYKESAEWKRLGELEILYKTKVANHLTRQHRQQVNRLLYELYHQIRNKVQGKGQLKGLEEADQLLGELGKWKLFDKNRRDLRKQLKSKYGKNWRKSQEWIAYQKENGFKLTDITKNLTESTEMQSKMPVAIQSELTKIQQQGTNPDAEYAEMKTKGLVETLPKDNILKKVWDLAKANPIPALAITAAGLYALVPPVRNQVNDMLGVKSKKAKEPSEAKHELTEKKLS